MFITMRQIQDWICPDWPAPANIRAYSTTRHGGNSVGPYTSMNLGDHVEDNRSAVQHNRAYLARALHLPSEPCWLFQTHSNVAIEVGINATQHQRADAAFATQPGVVCVALTADCLPILICNQQGTQVAAIHAGWRGLAGGIVDNTVAALTQQTTQQTTQQITQQITQQAAQGNAGQLLAWLGPAIGPSVFEVGEDVRNVFMQFDKQAAIAFVPIARHKWLANIYWLARQRLNKLGINAVYGGGYCTVTQYQQFYSYRREGKTGRMASLIWMDPAVQ